MNIMNITLKYALDTFHVNQASLNYHETGVEMADEKINVKVSNLTFDCHAKASFNTIPEFFHGKGTGKFNLSRLNSSVKFNFDKGANNLPKLNLIYSKVDLNSSNLNASFVGDNDIFTLLNAVGDLAIPAIIDLIGGEMKNTTIAMIQDTVNDLLGSLPDSMAIPGTNVSINYGLVVSPKVVDNYAPFALNGTSQCVGKCTPYEDKPKPPSPIKVFGGSRSLQLLLSDYIFSSFLHAAFESGLLKANVTSQMVKNMTNGSFALNTDLFGILIPEMRTFYGPHKDIDLTIAALVPPRITISPQGIVCILF
jgi:hypothetical protein